MEKEVIQSVGFRNTKENGEVTGFQFKVRLPYYRGVFLSQLRPGTLYVDGEKFEDDYFKILMRFDNGITAEVELGTYYLTDKCRCLELSELIIGLANDGVKKIILEPVFSRISIYHYKKQEQIFMIMNESSEYPYKGILSIPNIGEVVYYDAMEDCYKDLYTEVQNGIRQIPLILEPGESCVIMEKKEHITVGVYEAFENQILNCKNVISLNEGWQVELAHI